MDTLAPAHLETSTENSTDLIARLQSTVAELQEDRTQTRMLLNEAVHDAAAYAAEMKKERNLRRSLEEKLTQAEDIMETLRIDLSSESNPGHEAQLHRELIHVHVTLAAAASTFRDWVRLARPFELDQEPSEGPLSKTFALIDYALDSSAVLLQATAEKVAFVETDDEPTVTVEMAPAVDQPADAMAIKSVTPPLVTATASPEAVESAQP